MKQQALTVYDSLTKAYSPPFFAVNTAAGVRTFTDLVNEKGNNVSKHPEDFSLHWIGEFDDETGVLESVTPVNMGLAAKFKIKE